MLLDINMFGSELSILWNLSLIDFVEEFKLTKT